MPKIHARALELSGNAVERAELERRLAGSRDEGHSYKRARALRGA